MRGPCCGRRRRAVASFALAILAGLCAARAALAAGGPKVVSAEAMMDLKAAVQTVAADNFRLDFELDAAAPVARGDADIRGHVSREAGKWQPGAARARGYNTADHPVDGSGLTVSETAVRGTLKLTLVADRWDPDRKPVELSFEIDAAVTARRQAEADEPVPVQFWLIQPKSQGVAWKCAGTYAATVGGKAVKGAFRGTFQLPQRPGLWNMGTHDGSGLKLDFDMGKRRVNWNWARVALYELPKVRDLSGCDGLRIAIAADKPRADVSVSVWLQEADGSWYYLKGGVPLVDRHNEAVLPFEDFVEAEWVAPGNHMDEDYVLDLSAVRTLGVGIVNPFGCGEVGFTVTKIELVKLERQAEAPAAAAVTGRTLSVNGYEFVPPGLFGGYAPDLPQEYRPGCQRYLYAPSYPRMGGQIQAKFHEGSFKDFKVLLTLLTEGKDPLSAHLWELVPQQEDKRGQKSRRVPRSARDLADVLNRLLRDKALYDANAWAGVKLSGELKALAATAAAAKTDTRRMQIHRRLLDAAWPALLEPMPPRPPTEAFYIECFGERFQSAPLLHSRNWRESLANFGRTFAGHAKDNDYPAVFEFWNEPYLNWAERSRRNYSAGFFKPPSADGTVQVLYRSRDGNSVAGPVIPHLKWTDGMVRDPTAFSYWSGQGNGWIYDTMFAAMGKAIKDTYPGVTVIAGWGFRWHEDHWAPWYTLYKNTIDRGIAWIDGIHEHHYQGDTTAMNGSYEVLVSYCRTAHDKWVPTYNTECNDLVDAPARGPIGTPEKVAGARDYRRGTYNLRDIIYDVLQSPDKHLARTMIHHSQAPDGTRVCFTMLKELRGRLVETKMSDGDVWCVASIDGTDPRAMPPDGSGPRLCALVFNNRRHPRRVELTLDAPAGMTFGEGVIQYPVLKRPEWKLSLGEEKAPAGGAKRRTFALELPARGAWKIALALKGTPPGAAQVVRRQFFADKILTEALRGKPLTMTVKMDKEALAKAARAWLRCVVEDVAPGEGAVAVNGKAELELPKALTADNGNRIVEIWMDKAALGESNELVFRVNAGNHAGYRVDMASIVLETAAAGGP